MRRDDLRELTARVELDEMNSGADAKNEEEEIRKIATTTVAKAF